MYIMSGGNISGRLRCIRVCHVRRWKHFNGGGNTLHGLSDGNLLGERGGDLCVM